MDPITIAIGLASAVPSILKLFGVSDDRAAAAGKIVDAAKAITGSSDPAQAAAAIQANPQLQLQLAQEVNRHIEAMEAEKNKAAKDQADADAAAMQALTDRIAQLEGTASDLRAMPVLGPLMLFLRGAARPVIEYCVMYLDYMVFSGEWNLPDGPVRNSFFLINGLVLAFLFGERAVRNVAPLLTDMIAAKVAK